MHQPGQTAFGWVILVALTTWGTQGCGGSAKGGTEGETAAFVACGGALEGAWAYKNEHLVTPANPNVNACWNLMGGYFNGVYSASTRYPVPQGLETVMQFKPDGSYLSTQVRSGVVTLEYAPECLATPNGTPSCADLQATLYQAGIGEGSYRNTVCLPRAAGGCTCTVDVLEIGGGSGSWAVDQAARSVALTRQPGFDPSQVTVGYCADHGSLRFAPSIDKWWGSASQAAFAAVDCLDDQQGPGEEGIDCGFVCGNGCF